MEQWLILGVANDRSIAWAIAKALDRVGSETLTRTGHAIGTPRYTNGQSVEESVQRILDYVKRNFTLSD